MKLKLKKETNNFVAKDIDNSAWGKKPNPDHKVGFFGRFSEKAGESREN
jgi:hypothetical protein